MASRAARRGGTQRSRVLLAAAATGAVALAAVALPAWLADGDDVYQSRPGSGPNPEAAAPFGGLDPPATSGADSPTGPFGEPAPTEPPAAAPAPSGPFGGNGAPSPAAQPATGMAAQATVVDAADALGRLIALEVAEPVWEGYDRDLFEHWTLDEASGCDTRRLVLIAQAVRTPAVDAGCRLDHGAWVSPYDGRTYAGYGAGIEIDHLVPLAEAWRSGAWAWPPELRRAFANDARGLVAVSAESNQDKLAYDPAEWLPPDADTHCWYAAAWVDTKHRWTLSVDSAERDALTEILSTCPTAPTPTEGDPR